MTKKLTRSRVLVVVPTLGKRNDLLRLTLESIALQQPIEFDIVMVFPLKNKETVSLAKKYKAIMIDDPGGMSAAVNAGIAVAKPWHKYITWIGDDDLLTPNSLHVTKNTLDANPNAVLAFGYCDYITLSGKQIFTSRAGGLAPWLMTWGPDLIPMPGLMLRKSALDKVGEFDETNKWSMDLDMLLRLRKVGPFINTKKTLAKFRWHTTSQTVSNRPKVLAETEQVKRKYMSKHFRALAFLWERPIRVATYAAAWRVNTKARKLER